MTKYDLCCIGHITLDNVVTPQKNIYMPGGTSFYCSHAIRHLENINYSLLASIAKDQLEVVTHLQDLGVHVDTVISKKPLFFENKYGENQNDRVQKVLTKADPFTTENTKDIEATIFFLGALLADDFSLDFVKELSKRGLIAVDSQGYLRKVVHQDVHPTDWDNKYEFMKYIHFLKVNEMELEVLTGESDIRIAAKKLFDWGIKEVVITLGDMGSIIYDGNNFYPIPAYAPKEVVDATGCGDTYMTGYLYKRALGADYTESAKFGAAMATIKIEKSGPFNSKVEEIYNRISNSEQHIPSF